MKPYGWMFSGMFAGSVKGPGFFWEKEWGTVTAYNYIFLFLPLVRAFLRTNQLSIFQQDNARSHTAKITTAALCLMEVLVLLWLAHSPDLNPIENVWFVMKDWVEYEYDI